MYERLKYGGDGLPYNYSVFLCEYVSDINLLPIKTSDTDGCCVGSKAFVFENNKTYILKIDKTWDIYEPNSSCGIGDDYDEEDVATVSETLSYLNIQ